MLSVVIPVLNEAETIISVLRHLTENASEANIAEIIIVDGGSTDQTQQLVKTFATRLCKRTAIGHRIGPTRVRTLKTSKMHRPNCVATATVTSEI